LKRLEFIYEQTTAEEPVYLFKHALTQEVAYESLLRSRRQALHAAAGRAMETLYADRLEEVYDRLAYHYAQTDASAKAIEYLSRFAAKAARLYAHTDAARALERALEHVERLPEEEQDRRQVELALRLAYSQYFLGRVSETLPLLLANADRVERLADPALAGPYEFWLGHTYSYLSDQERAIEHARRALAFAQQCGDRATLGKAHFLLARAGFWLCRFSEAIEHGGQAVALLDGTDEWLWLGLAHWAIGFSHTFLGEFEAGLAAEARARAIGEAFGDPRLQTYADWTSGWLYATRGDWEQALAVGQRSLEQSRDAFNTACATSWLGFSYLEKDDLDRAIVMLESGIEQFERLNYRAPVSWYRAWLAEALRRQGQAERAATEAREALAIGQAFKTPYGVAWARRMLGRLALDRGDPTEAAAHLAAASQLFIDIGARFEVGLTELALAELAQARREPAAVVAHRQTARGIFASLAAPKRVARVDALLTAARPAPEPVVADPLAGFTRREREVLPLLARGLTNPQIAAELSISERTAEVHVANILGKLGYSTRAQAAAWATQRGLLGEPAG
jgi:DNA-binding CsgD family transcriptional regulator/tetratricopeptide (TPR) repeat protein